MNKENDAELIDGLDRLVTDADELIAKFGIKLNEIIGYGGSDRYRRVSVAYDRLAGAEQQLPGERIIIWETTAVNGRTGAYLMEKLWTVKKRLIELGESTLAGPV